MTRSPFYTSLYKGRLYILTSNGSKYSFDGGANIDTPIEDGTVGSIDVEAKLNKYGYGIRPGQEDKDKSYYVIDYKQTAVVGTAAVDYTALTVGTNSFSVTASGVVATTFWTAFKLVGAVTVSFELTAEQIAEFTADGSGNGIVTAIKEALDSTETGVAGYKMGDVYEPFLYDTHQIGFKTKVTYAGVGYDATLTNVSANNFVTNIFKTTSGGAITGTATKFSNDYDALVTAVGAGTDVVIVQENSMSTAGGLSVISIPSTQITEIIAELQRVPETFRVRY